MSTIVEQQPQQSNLSLSIDEAFKRGFEDIDVFTSIVIPDIAEFRFPPEYTAIWQMLVKAAVANDITRIQQIIRFVFCLPRGFAKTTFIKVIVCWFICYDLAFFILIVCATEPLAENFLEDVDLMLSTPLVARIYGNWASNKATDNKQLKTGTFRRHAVIIAALGAGTSLRGLNIHHKRPDLLIMDDMQTKENDESEAERERLFRWLVGTLLKAINPRFCLCIYIGNMYSTTCIIFQLKESPYWISLVTGCILADGTSLWPELHPIERLFESFSHDESLGQGAIWMAELMNDPINIRKTLLPGGAFPPSELVSELIFPDAGFITVDPAGFRDISDDNVYAAYYVIDGKSVLMEMDGGIWNPKETIYKTLHAAVRLGIPVVAIETTAYQQSLKFWCEEFIRETKLTGISILEIGPKGRTKESRIRAWIARVLAKDTIIHSTDARSKLVWQALKYKIGQKKNKDDWLDCAAYEEDVRNEYWDEIMNMNLSSLKPVIEAAVIFNNTPF